MHLLETYRRKLFDFSGINPDTIKFKQFLSNSYLLGSLVFFSSELVFVVDDSVVAVFVAGLPVEVVPEGRVAGLPVVVVPEGGVVGLVAAGLLVSVGRVAGFSCCGLTGDAGFVGCGFTGDVGRTGYTGAGLGAIVAGGVFSYMKSYLLSHPLRNSTA
jgi:hypothetical protein